MSSGGGGNTQPDLYSEYYGELLAKSQMAPLVYSTEAQYDPAYTALNLNDLNTELFGANNLQVNTPSWAQGQNPVTGNFPNIQSPYAGTGISGGAAAPPNLETVAQQQANQGQRYTFAYGHLVPVNGMGTGSQPSGNLLPNQPAPTPPGLLPNSTATLPSQSISAPGLTQLVNQAAIPFQSAQSLATSANRASNVGDLNAYGGAAISAMNNADPQAAALLNSMTGQATSELNMGAQLDPSLNRLATQAVRAQNNGMLGGTGNAGDYAAALGLSQYGQNLKNLRQQYASNVLSQRGSYYGNTINSIMNGGTTVNPLSQLSTGYGMSQGGPRLYGSDINAGQVYSDALNANVSQQNAAANNSAAMTSAGISAGAGLASAGLLALALS